MFFGRHTCLPWIFDDEHHRAVPILAEIGGAPPYVIVVGDRRRAGRILDRLDEALDLAQYCREQIGELAGGRVDLGIGRTGGVPVMVAESQMGGSATEIIMREVLDESFHPDGARAVIRVGSCGTIGDTDALPPLAIASFATGWSAAIEQWQRGVLAPPAEHDTGRPEHPPIVHCSESVVAALAEGARRVAPGVKAEIGGIFSKDSLYSEQDDRFAEILISLDCIATEMELSTIGPIADWKGIAWGGIMASAGRVPDGPWLEPAEIERNENRAIEAALAAIEILDAQRRAG
jgi:uridine phosphorylase